MRPDPKKTEAYLQIIERQAPLRGRFSRLRRVDPVGGDGAFSLVCLAQDDRTGQEVALKFFHPDCYTPNNPYRWESFKRESQILAEFQGSKDIIGLVSGQEEFEYAPDPTIPFTITFAYYVMQAAPVGLDSIIAGNLWTPRQLLLGMRCIVRAVQRIHSAHTAHRDLKPGNLRVVGLDVKLSDFGTARCTNEGSLIPQYLAPPGDRRYASPEMIACLHDVDARIAFCGDFFALGAILFELFSGAILGLRLFTPEFLTDLNASMSVVPRDRRIEIYGQVIGSINARYPLPTISSLNPSIPACIRPRLDQLFRDLCALDYRRRAKDFSQIFRAINTCILILDNEQKYAAWNRERQKRRSIRILRKNGVTQ